MATTTKPELGKWGLYRLFSKDPNIRPYLPPTTMLTLNSLRSYLHQYKTVYIKPSAGYGGRGIIKAWTTANGFAFVHERGNPVQAGTVAELFRKVRAVARPGVLYLVQKGIDLPKIQGRPFDIRLMMGTMANGSMSACSPKWQANKASSPTSPAARGTCSTSTVRCSNRLA